MDRIFCYDSEGVNNMRIAIIVFVIIVLVLFGCNQRNVVNRNEFSKPLYENYPLSVYCKDSKYFVCNGHSYEEVVEKYLIFSEKRTLIEKVNLNFRLLNASKVATADALIAFLGMNSSELEKTLGRYHFDLGSGLFKPSYITSDAYLITFVFFSDEVAVVAKTDLLTGYSEEYPVLG